MKIKFFILLPKKKPKRYVLSNCWCSYSLLFWKEKSQHLAYTQTKKEEIIVEVCEHDNASRASKSLRINRELAWLCVCIV